MVVSEGAINNIMGGMENTAGVRLHSHRHKLKQRFDIIRKLGQGTYGKVQLAVNKETGQEWSHAALPPQVAIKTIKKAKIETEQDLIRIRREIQIMSSVQHPQIIHIYEVFENREKMVLVMEYAAGGELYDYLSERKVLPEEEARRVFRHVASATYYCHKHKICHRDLKLENILLDLEGNAKIADFGLSNVFDDGHRLDTFCGSPLYASPEIVKGIPYTGPEVDCWSLGVLLYTLVYGAMPFDGSNFKRLVKQITQGDYYEPKKPSRASDLIRGMLTVSATKRASVEDICAHWWVNEGYTESCLDIAETLANQTPVRLDLLLSLAPKHINSEHMLIQPDDEDSSMRSPPTSECGRAPPELQLPPPPPPPSDSTQPSVARTSSLSGIYSVNTSDLDALFAQRKKEKKDADKKRKTDDVNSLEKKKKKDVAEGTPRPIRKESCPNQEIVSSGPKPPSVPVEANSSEKKKIVKKVEENETSDKSEKTDRRKSIKRRDSTVENDTSDKNEQPDRRRSLVKRRESTVEREISANDKKKIVVKKRESSAGRPSKEETADRRRSIRATETPTREIRPNDIPPRELKPVASSAVDSVSEPSSVINLDKSDTEDQTAASTMKPPLPKDQGNKLKPPSNEGKSSRSSSNKSLNGLDSDGAASMEVVEIVESLVADTSPEGAQNSASMRSVGSSNEITLKASDSSISRESASPMKLDGPIKGKESPKPSSSQTNLVKKTRSKSLIKNNSKSTVNEVPSVNGELTKSAAPSEVGKENIPQETTDIKHDKESKIPTSVKIQDSSSKVEESAKESSKSVSDAKKAFEKPTIAKPLLGPRKTSVTDTSSTVPKPQANLSTPQIAKGRTEKSPSKEKVLKKELEKEKSPRKELEKEKSPKKEKEASKSPRRSCTPLRECEKAKKKEVETNRIKEEKVINKEEDKSEEIIPNIKGTKEVGGGVSSSMSNAEENLQVARAGVDDRLVKPKTPTHTVEVSPRDTTVTSSHKEDPVVVGGLELKLGGIGKIAEVGTKQNLVTADDSSDSSESESEAEKILKIVSEKREKIEAAKREKLRKNSEAKEKINIVKQDMPSIKEEIQSKIPSKSPSKSPEKSSEQKFATLPRGFKTKSAKTAAKAASIPNGQEDLEKVRTNKNINEEIEGMMSAIKAVDRAITQEEEDLKTLRDSLVRSLPESQAELTTKSRQSSKSPGRRPQIVKEVQVISPAEVLAPSRREEALIEAPNVTNSNTQQDTSTKQQRKAKIDIVLNKTEEPKSLNRRSSHAEIKLSSPPPKESPRTKEFKTEIRHSVSSPRSNEGHRITGETQVRSGDAHLQRAKRERIIPIMLEDTDDEDNTTSEPLPHRAGSAERKSRRERIIPIQVEGCGVVTPSTGPHVDEAAELGSARAHQAFQRSMGARAHSLSRGGNFHLDHSESFSSAGEEDEDEEDDAFQILTAESLFSTLLNRVRSLTRKMNDDPRVTTTTGSRRSSQQPTPEPMMGPGHVGSGPSGSSGFWSSLYSSPRDSPSRRENMSHSSIGRDDETLGGMGSPLWTRSVSRDTSDADTFFSEASTPFGTLPRGWKSRWSGGEDGGDSDTSEASARSQGGRRIPYSRGPSRELHNIPDDQVLRTARGGPTGGTFPRPYTTSNSRSDGAQQQRIVPQDSAERVVAMYGTMKRRPKSSMSGLVGEGFGREAGNFEPQPQHHNPPRPHTAAADVGGPDMQQYSRTPQLSPTSYLSDPSEERADTIKQSVHEQLQQLVRELESVPDEPANEAAKILRQLSPSLQQNPPEYNLANRLSKIPTPRSAMSPPPISGHSVNVPCTTSAGAIVKPKVINRKTVSPAKECVVTNGTNPTNIIQSSNIGTVQAGVGGTIQSSSVGAVQIGLQGAAQSTLHGSEQPGLATNENNSIKSKQVGNDNVGYNAILDISKNGVPAKLGVGEKKEPGVVRTSENVHIQVNKVKGTQDNSGNFPNQSTGIHTLPILDQTSSSSSCSSRPSSGESNVSIANTDVETSSSPSTVTTTPKTNTLPSSSLMPIASTTTASMSHNSNVKIPENSSTFNTIPRVSSNNNSISNTSSVATSSSSTGISVRSNSRTNLNARNSFSGSNLSTNSLNRADLLQPKTYRRSKSKELTPAIEAAGEKITQLHSGTLKRISPFEAYRKSKSRELPLSTISKQEKNIKAISPPERAKSPFERAKSSIETKFNRSKSPMMDKAKKVGETIIGEIKPATPILKRAASMTIPQGNDIHINGNDEDAEKDRESDESKEKSKLKKTASCEPEKPKSMYKLLASKFNRSGSNVPETTGTENSNEKKLEADENEKDDKFTLKRPSGFLKKATKSSSRTSLNDVADDELSDRSDRKPSKKLSDALNKFLGRKDSKEEQSRKSSREESRSAHTPSPQPTTITDTLATTEVADPSKLPRVKPKKFSMSQEHLNRVDEIVENGLSNGMEQKDNIVAPEGQQTDVTLASVTKSICDHLSQLENDITYRIGNIGVNEKNMEIEILEGSNGLNEANMGGKEGKGGVDVTMVTADGIKTSTSNSVLALTNTQIHSPVSNYGLSPALANRRSARPTNLDLASTGSDSKKQMQSDIPSLNSPSQRSMIIANNREVTNNSPKPFPLTSPTDEMLNYNVHGLNNNPNTNMNNNNIKNNNENISKGQIELNENDTVKFARIKRIGGGEGVEDESLTPTESGSTTSGNDEGRSSAMSDQEDESVMDRIMRKSYYSRFQEAKKPAATRKVNTKESIDQQLAAAKTRLMIEDQQKGIRALSPPNRDMMSPSRVTSPMSPRNSMVNQPNRSELNRRPSRKSLPPEEYNPNFGNGNRRSNSIQRDDPPTMSGNGNRRSNSIQRDDPPTMRRLTSMPPEEKVKRRFSSVTREESAPRRMNRTSVPRDDMVNYIRTTPQREMYPASNNYRSKEDLTDGNGQAQEVVAVAAAVGAAAGVAASIAASERAGSRSRESSLSRLKSPEPQGPRGWTPTRDETLNNAREELSRRIGHLTRFSGAGSSSSSNSNSNSSNSSSNANTKSRVIRPYGRTSTTQVYPPPPPFTPSGSNNMSPSSRQPDRPAYRRTNTMDLPPSEAQARPGSEYRRMLQDPARRYSATRPFQQMPNKESDPQEGGDAQHSGGHSLRRRNPAHPQAVYSTDPHQDQTHPTVPMAPQTSALWAQQQRHSLAAPLFTVTEDPNAQYTPIQDISSPSTLARVVSPDSFSHFQAKTRGMSPKSTLVSPRGWKKPQDSFEETE